MSLYLSIIGESKKNEGLDSTTFTLKDGTRKTTIVKATSFYNPNDSVSGNGIKLVFLIDNKRIGIANISGIDTDMPFMYDFEVNEKYRTTLINFAEYELVMFTTAKIIEMEQVEINKVALYLFNSIKIVEKS